MFEEGNYNNFYYDVACDKPSPLTEAFDFEYFLRIFKEAKSICSIKKLLATEQRIPGLGNGVLQDILFRSRLNPQTKLSDMIDNQVESLFANTKSTLLEMTQKGGRDTEKDIYRNFGGYKTILSSKTFKDPCPRCAGPIERKAYLGGNVYFCPHCQPLA